jgi:hypothetical protein
MVEMEWKRRGAFDRFRPPKQRCPLSDVTVRFRTILSLAATKDSIDYSLLRLSLHWIISSRSARSIGYLSALQLVQTGIPNRAAENAMLKRLFLLLFVVATATTRLQAADDFPGSSPDGAATTCPARLLEHL